MLDPVETMGGHVRPFEACKDQWSHARPCRGKRDSIEEGEAL